MPVDQGAINVVQSKIITLQYMAATLENMDLTLSPQDGRMETGFAQGPFTFSLLKIVSLSYPTLQLPSLLIIVLKIQVSHE